MKKKNNFFAKLLSAFKGFGRKFLITLKKNPQYIPFVLLLFIAALCYDDYSFYRKRILYRSI